MMEVTVDRETRNASGSNATHCQYIVQPTLYPTTVLTICKPKLVNGGAEATRKREETKKETEDNEPAAFRRVGPIQERKKLCIGSVQSM